MFRVCHLNTCAVGVATQKENLRAKYSGNVERVINYFTFVAEEVREILASLGYKSLEEIIGKTELLKVIDNNEAKNFNFSELLEKVDGIDTTQVETNEPYDKNEYEKEIVKALMPTIKEPKEPIVLSREISNLNRSFGARISGEIAAIHGNKGLFDGAITLKMRGVAGQSLGAFLANGVNIYINGAGNDYIGKGMSGGMVVITSSTPNNNFSLGGNTCLYGATGGKLYIAGQVGERFGVRNSGALAIVEGTGDHPCEYMTGGTVVILGETGINFGAGMTGGQAFVYDIGYNFYEKVNHELVDAVRVDTDEHDTEMFELKKHLKDYYKETGSLKAKEILDGFRSQVRNFWLVSPRGITLTQATEKKGE